MATQTQIKAKVRECVKLAKDLYGFDVKYDDIKIEFKGKGQAAASAWWKATPFGRQYGLKFSTESANLDSNEMLNDTVPHEVAHLVCMADPTLGKNHDYGWKRVCIALGGTGARTHSQVLTKARYKAQYEYRLGSTGQTTKVGPKIHKNIQVRLVTYTHRATRVKFGKDDFVRKISSEEHRREHQKKVTEYRNAAKGNEVPASSHKRPTRKPAAPRVPTTGSLSKKDQAMSIYRVEGGNKATCISRFMSDLSMSKAGATTYYYNCRKEA